MNPAQAQEYLSSNKGNRNIRNSWVNELIKIIKNDEWCLTHQGIAISKDGRLLDGQHRLIAISLSGVSVPISVTENCEDDTFLHIDKGVKRSLSDSISVDRKITEILSVFLKIASARYDRPELAKKIMKTDIGFASELLISTCRSARRVASSAAIKAGAVMAMIDLNQYEEISKNYRTFILADYDNMPPALKSFERRISTGHINLKDPLNTLYPTSYKAFCLLNRASISLRVSEAEMYEIKARTRNYISNLIELNSND